MEIRSATGTARHWRVFYTRARAEKQCEERLAAAAIEVFLPKLVITRQWADRRKKVVEPLFPNYIFARVNEAERIRALQQDGIVRTIMEGKALAAVAPEEIEQLRIAQREPERLAAALYPRPAIGNRIEISHGPLAGLRGEVLRHQGDTHVVVCVSVIRQAVRVHVPDEWVTAIPEPHRA